MIASGTFTLTAAGNVTLDELEQTNSASPS